MSHYTGHNPPTQVPRARVAFFGASLVAAGIFGFYAFLEKRHERKLALDRASQGQARISSWEHRLLYRGEPAPSPSDPDSDPDSAVLRAARIEARSTPLASPTSTHNVRHRTVAEEAANATTANANRNGNVNESGRPTALDQPTAQKGHSDGREGVYTKRGGWREAAHYATNGNGKTSSSQGSVSAVDGEVQKAQKVVEKVGEGVKNLVGK